VTKHDPTEEAETLPGIPKAGSDLEQFPSVPGLIGAAFNIDVAIQEITAVLAGLSVSVAITAVADLSRTYLQIQGTAFGILSGAGDEDGTRHTCSWTLTSTTSVRVRRAIGGGSLTLKIAVIEFL
jgi:hypothetical protein